jgi:hypothetical protein
MGAVSTRTIGPSPPHPSRVSIVKEITKDSLSRILTYRLLRFQVAGCTSHSSRRLAGRYPCSGCAVATLPFDKSSPWEPSQPIKR